VTSPFAGALPVCVRVDGEDYPIRHDFRDGIRFETLMFDERVPESAKVALALGIWFPALPDADLGRIIEAMLAFYRCGKPSAPESESDERLYSYEHDWDAIFAGFLTAYGIDLLDPTVELHWWKFRSMLAALPEDSQFMRIVGYRGVKLSGDMGKEQRAFLRKMKALYALPCGGSMRPVPIRDEASLQAALAAVRKAKGQS